MTEIKNIWGIIDKKSYFDLKIAIEELEIEGYKKHELMIKVHKLLENIKDLKIIIENGN